MSETKYLTGSWVVNINAPPIPSSVITYRLEDDNEEEIYNTYGIALKEIHFDDGWTIYGSTPFLTQILYDGSTRMAYICKCKGDDEDYFQYVYYTSLDEDFSYVNFIPGEYNYTSVSWIELNAQAASTSIIYKGLPLVNILAGQKVTLQCEGMMMESDLVIETETIESDSAPTYNGEVEVE